MKAYRVKHIPTGLYFKSFHVGSPSNLSKNGRVYLRKPNIMKWTKGKLRLDYNKYEKTKDKDWLIEEFEIN